MSQSASMQALKVWAHEEQDTEVDEKKKQQHLVDDVVKGSMTMPNELEIYNLIESIDSALHRGEHAVCKHSKLPFQGLGTEGAERLCLDGAEQRWPQHSKLPYQGVSSPWQSKSGRKVAPSPSKLPVNERPYPDERQPRSSAPPKKNGYAWSMYQLARPERGEKLRSGALVSW